MAVSRRHDKYYRPANNSGFTIIEVVLVLAIAGLIFIVVFLALPALQKSQRDNARKQDVGKMIAGLQQYAVDHDNQWPSTGWIFPTGYFSGMAQVSSGFASIYIAPTSAGCRVGSANGWTNSIQVSIGCKCSTITSGTVDVTAKYAAVYMWLESGSTYCEDM